MTTPARDRPGPLGTKAYLAAGTVELRDYAPRPHASEVTLWCRASSAGTVTVTRLDGFGKETLVDTFGLVAMTDADADVVKSYSAPVGSLRFEFQNTDATAGTIAIQASDNAPGG